MKSEPVQRHGHPLTVAGVVGSFALAVGLVVWVSGVMRGVNLSLSISYREAGFPTGEEGQPGWSIFVVLILVYGLAYLMLDIPGTGRRALVAVTILVLTAVASPALALWGVFWSPFVALVSGAWSAFCAILWARHHPMPCEAVLGGEMET